MGMVGGHGVDGRLTGDGDDGQTVTPVGEARRRRREYLTFSHGGQATATVMTDG